METSGHGAGMSSLYSTYQNKLTGTAPPPEEGSQRRKEEKGYVFALQVDNLTTDSLLAA